jgi:hypothetical protein
MVVFFGRATCAVAALPRSSRPATQKALALLTFCDYPAEHCVHLHTANPIESASSTVRHRARVTKGPGSRATARRLSSSPRSRFWLVEFGGAFPAACCRRAR